MQGKDYWQPRPDFQLEVAIEEAVHETINAYFETLTQIQDYAYGRFLANFPVDMRNWSSDFGREASAMLERRLIERIEQVLQGLRRSRASDPMTGRRLTSRNRK